MATVKKYNLAGVSTNVELGKQGSYLTGNASAIGFYTSGDALQKIAIANATAASHAVTKAQLDATSSDLVQHITVDVEHDSGAVNFANIGAGTRIISVTVDVPEDGLSEVDPPTEIGSIQRVLGIGLVPSVTTLSTLISIPGVNTVAPVAGFVCVYILGFFTTVPS